MQLKSTESNGGSADKSALEGLSVLDFSHVLSGLYCTLLLSDYGATVYKIEPIDGGEAGRGWGPPFAGDQASFFLELNRGKLGVCSIWYFPEAYKNEQHGKLLLMAPRYDRSGTLGFRCVKDAQ